MLLFHGRKTQASFQDVWHLVFLVFCHVDKDEKKIPSSITVERVPPPCRQQLEKKCRRLWLTISEIRVTEKRRIHSCFRIIWQSIFLSAIFLSTGIKMLALIQRHLIPLLHYRSCPAVAASVER